MASLNREQVLADITSIIRNELSDNSLTIEESSAAADVPSWDSLAHIGIILGTEKHFGIKMKAYEVAGLERVGSLVDLVLARSATA